ncbi:HPP family protein [Streptomyces sp. MUM 203J]|uniref:HPP family protein n=1 Tax=Streptomyces sp. MUM 203J TaxID=2791990 RepID=UPI001F039D8E|nr:HPP family protein [Streptomyces sp. MUM 203J]MCH0541214.1 HPP family protein [Streptomyces sp. MUM 203J]
MSESTVTDAPAQTEVTALRRFRAAFAGKAPARAPKAAISVATLGSVAALVALVVIGVLLDQTVLIPPLAASAALVFAAPALPLSQPRSVVGGQLISAVVGFLCLAVGGSSMWTAAVAGGLAAGAMALARTPHSPAAATAVIVVLTQPSTALFLLLLLLATLVLVGIGILAGRSGKTARYPTYWW